MPGNSFARFSHCSYSSSLRPSVFHPAVAIHGQSLHYSPWKSLVSGLPGSFEHNTARPWYCIPSRALRGLKTTHYRFVAGKRAGQDLLITERDKCYEKKSDFYGTGSEKGWISALSRSEGGRGDEKDKKVKFAEEPVTVLDDHSDSESEEEEANKKLKKENKLKCEEEEDSESDSDDEEEMPKIKNCTSKGKAEVTGMSEDDSGSSSDEEKEMRKKMKADKKELKKQAKKKKKELKALKVTECEDRESEDDNKEEEKKEKVKENGTEKVVVVPEDKRQISQNQYLDEPDSGSDGGYDGEESDVVEVVPRALGDEQGGEDDFELIQDEDLYDEIESEIEAVFEDFEDEDLDDDFWDEEEGEVRVGDGGDGGGVVLGESLWGNKALELAQLVVKDLGTDFAIYAFKASPDGLVRVRIDKLSDQYGSPTMTEIETFSRKYSETLDSSEVIPDSVAVEVSSPGAERIVKLPDELERFKMLPMYVEYCEDDNEERDGVLELESLDSGSGMTIWKLANVKFNREQSGKGRPLNSKQRKWRAHVPLNSLKLVRLYLDV